MHLYAYPIHQCLYCVNIPSAQCEFAVWQKIYLSFTHGYLFQWFSGDCKCLLPLNTLKNIGVIPFIERLTSAPFLINMAAVFESSENGKKNLLLQNSTASMLGFSGYSESRDVEKSLYIMFDKTKHMNGQPWFVVKRDWIPYTTTIRAEVPVTLNVDRYIILINRIQFHLRCAAMVHRLVSIPKILHSHAIQSNQFG